jgi:hypothetical protein
LDSLRNRRLFHELSPGEQVEALDERESERRFARPRLHAVEPPHEQDLLLRAMYNQDEFLCLLDHDIEVDISNMEDGGTQFIRDFLQAHDVPRDAAKKLNTFLMTLYLGTSGLEEQFRLYAGDREPCKAGFRKMKYLERLAKVHLWLKKKDVFESFEKELHKVIEFTFLAGTMHPAFVLKRMKDLKRWIAVLRAMEVKTLEDAKIVNVGIIGARYGVQQMWTVAVLYLKMRGQLKNKSSSLDGQVDRNLIS